MGKALRYKASTTRRVAHRTETAAGTIGPLNAGEHVTGVTAGQFSSIDAMEHIANELGPCHAWISTWTTGVYDVHRASAMMDNAQLLGVRFILDRGTFEKSPKFAGPLIETVGEEAFRCMSVHAKVTVMVSDTGEPLAAMRSSMNLNKNLRTEQFDISVGGEVSAFYAEWFEAIWEEAGIGGDNVEIMRGIFDRFKRSEAGDDVAASDILSGLSLGVLDDA